jgi:hypothetical protein
MLPVAGKHSRTQQTRGDRWLKELPVPVGMRYGDKRTRRRCSYMLCETERATKSAIRVIWALTRGQPGQLHIAESTAG